MRGYVKDKDGNVLYKVDLPSDREHKLNLKTGEKFIKVENLSTLKAKKVYKILPQGMKREKLIQAKIRDMAIKELIKEGKLEMEIK